MYYIFFICTHEIEELAKFNEKLNNFTPNIKFIRESNKKEYLIFRTYGLLYLKTC